MSWASVSGYTRQGTASRYSNRVGEPGPTEADVSAEARGGNRLTEVVVCGRCGARLWPGTQTCPACGQPLAPSGQILAAPGQPPVPYPPVPYPPVPYPPAGWSGLPVMPQYAQPGIALPLGVIFLALAEIGIGVVGFVIAMNLWTWIGYRFDEGQAAWGMIDLGLALAYVATSVYAFSLARGLWLRQAWAWKQACLLSIVLLGMILSSVFMWGLTSLDIIGMVVHMSVLTILNIGSVRRAFGRQPLTA
jgi:hypothetical protein